MYEKNIKKLSGLVIKISTANVIKCLEVLNIKYYNKKTYVWLIYSKFWEHLHSVYKYKWLILSYEIFRRNKNRDVVVNGFNYK